MLFQKIAGARLSTNEIEVAQKGNAWVRLADETLEFVRPNVRRVAMSHDFDQ
jgi:hypothetical protein